MQLYSLNVTQKRSFSLYFSYAGLENYEVSLPSNLQFGTSDLFTYSTDPVFSYIPLVDWADGWVVQLGGVWINEERQETAANQARFSTQTMLMCIPHSAYANFISQLNNSTNCGSFPNHMISCPCSADSEYPNLTLELGGMVISVSSEAYIYRVSHN
jgi:hypothetical protein